MQLREKKKKKEKRNEKETLKGFPRSSQYSSIVYYFES